MNTMFKHLVTALLAVATVASLSGCIISGLSGSTVGGLTTVTATVNLQRPSTCTVDSAAQTTSCTSNVTVMLPNGITDSFPFSITLKGFAAAIPFFDPVIVEVPASMSNFAGSIAVGPAGVTPGTPLSITSGLTSVPVDANTNLVAEPGMQLVIIDFQAPQSAPFGQYTLNFQFSGTATSIKVLFSGKITAGSPTSDEKAAQTYYLPIYPCVTDFAYVPAIQLPVVNIAQLISLVTSAQGCSGKVYDVTAGGGGPAATVDVIEFYNAGLDHYFITWVANEIHDLDAGVHVGWARTGKSFKAYPSAQPGTSDICRYYIPPAEGDSHFFGRGTVECNATGAAHPEFVLEDPKFMAMFLPDAGRCPERTTEVHRVFDNRPDANHRYMTDPAIEEQMIAKGWIPEGDGPGLVVMCAPQ